jgi:hypothetical protein
MVCAANWCFKIMKALMESCTSMIPCNVVAGITVIDTSLVKIEIHSADHSLNTG